MTPATVECRHFKSGYEAVAGCASCTFTNHPLPISSPSSPLACSDVMWLGRRMLTTHSTACLAVAASAFSLAAAC